MDAEPLYLRHLPRVHESRRTQEDQRGSNDANWLQQNSPGVHEAALRPTFPGTVGDRPLQPSQTNPTVSHVAQSASREIWPKSWIRGCWNQKRRMRFWRRHTRMQPLLCTKTCGKKRHTMRRARILTTRRRARDKSDCSTGPFGSWDLEHPPM